MTSHQKGQIEVINQIERQLKNNSINFSTVSPIADFEKDKRLCLTSVHFPPNDLIQKIQETIINPLKKISPDHFYYDENSLHMTIKNIRLVNDPPHFDNEEIEKTKQIFSRIIPAHRAFNVYFYRLILFPNNLSLTGTTDSELDNIILDLDEELKIAGIPDDKKYLNSQYFFSNMTLVRFTEPVSKEFKEKVNKLSSKISFLPYLVDSVSLISATATLGKLNKIQTWLLKK